MMTEAADKGADPGAGSGGPGVGYPMDPNTQGPPSYNMADQFYFGNNGTMPSDMGPFFSDGTLHNYQAQFDFGGNNPPSGGFMNDPRASYFNNNPDSTLYQDMVTNNHDDVDLYNPAVNNNHVYQFPPLPNDHEAGSSNPVFPYNYGCPNDELQNEYRTGGDDAEGEDGDGEGGGAQDPYGGFNNFNNFGRGN
ncbi:hypothetical protein CASFOL_035966 [Castilleja foliolosa]|uniref:Bindin n=1 Tax=Castilleja foliolosa TaxID=1961234 RepID=A0ABD3BVD3_9LAMI